MIFDFFKSREQRAKDYADTMNNVVPFPAQPSYIEPPEKDPVTFYSIGPTDNNRINFKMGYSSITMTKLGVESLIALLQVAATQLTDEDDE